MLIQNGLRELGARTLDRDRQAQQLRKRDVIQDLFNNQPPAGPERAGSKLRLSRTARHLSRELESAVEDLMKRAPDLRQATEEISLPEGEHAPLSRKLRSYAQWLQIRQPGESELEDVAEAEQPYLKVHQTGHDEEIAELFSTQDEARRGHVEQRNRHAPNYYYLAYPETYAFN